jgi:hypothetical protein
MTIQIPNTYKLTFAALIAAIAFLCPKAKATIGETLAQSSVSYGQPSGKIAGGATYWDDVCWQSNGTHWRVIQLFNAYGVCDFIAYIKLDGTEINSQESKIIDVANYGDTVSSNWIFIDNRTSSTQLNSFWRSTNTGYWLAAGHTSDFGGYKAQRIIATTEGFQRFFEVYAPKKSASKQSL